MTTAELIERAKRQLHMPDLEIDLAACVMQASSAVAQMVMRDSALRGLLQQEYTINLDSSGKGDLLTATGSVTGAAGEILIDGVRAGAVLDAEGQRLQPLRHYHDFLAPQHTAYAYYCIKDKAAILTRARDMQVNTSFDIQSATGPLTITASYTPNSVDDFPPETEDMLVNELCRIVATKINADSKYP
jgi:hypothetical protein